jgi:hypothetical protein
LIPIRNPKIILQDFKKIRNQERKK